MKWLILMLVAALSLSVQTVSAKQLEKAVFAGGCFWCVESDFDKVPGVVSTTSGYTGGKTKNPTYKQVTYGDTGHYEAVEITYDPAKVSYEMLLTAFWHSVDPTDDGGQFCDRGDSYRTAVFVLNDKQRKAAEASRKRRRRSRSASRSSPRYSPPPRSTRPSITTRTIPRTTRSATATTASRAAATTGSGTLWGENAFKGIPKN